MAKQKQPAAASLHAGGSNGHGTQVSGTRAGQRRPHRANDHTTGVGNPDELVRGRGISQASATLRLHAPGCGAAERTNSILAVAGEVQVVALQLFVWSVWASSVCHKRVPLNESIDLEIEDRIRLGDLEVIHDMVRESMARLEPLAEQAAALLCSEPETLARLAEMRIRQDRTGRQWHGADISGAITEPVATDRGRKEPRGTRHGQDRPRRATVGKPDNRGSGSC